jgi:hypothetical protein
MKYTVEMASDGMIYKPSFMKCRLSFNKLRSVISQQIVLFITTAARTSNPTILRLLPPHSERPQCWYY